MTKIGFYKNFGKQLYILSMVTLKSGIILDKNDDVPLKWANVPYPIQIHADFIILMGL